MPMTLESVTIGGSAKPPKVVIHGLHGVGKTTFAVGNPLLKLAGSASPIVLRTEDGLAALRVPTFPIARNYQDVVDAITVLYSEEHPYQTLVVDSMDWLEPLVWAETCRRHNQGTIESFGFGKGYLHADEVWREIFSGLDALTEKGITVVCIAHSEIRRFDSPETEPYERYAIKLHKRAAALLDEWADVIGFARFKVYTEKTDVGFNKKVIRGASTGERELCVEERPAYDAKNRYGMPAFLPLNWQSFMGALAGAYAVPVDPAESGDFAVTVVETEADIAAVVNG